MNDSSSDAVTEDLTQDFSSTIETEPFTRTGEHSISMRVPADFAPHIFIDDMHVNECDPWYGLPCLVCNDPIGPERGPAALVALGVLPKNRRRSGWVDGVGVVLHEKCVTPPPPIGQGRRDV